mgnify:CR=1 FL=1
MKHCTTLAGESVTIEHVEYLQFKKSIDELFEQVKTRVQAAEPVTPDTVIGTTVVALGDALPSLSLEDQLELKTVIDYPGDPAASSNDHSIAIVFSSVLSTIGSWRAADATAISA